MTFPAAIALKEMTGKPLVVHIHSLTYDRIGPGDQGWVFRVEKEALSMADLILPVSHYTGEIIHEHYGIAKNKIWPVHNGARRIKTFRRDKKFPEKMILFLGRITFQKGPEYFLAMAQLIIEQFRNVRFVIAGDGDRFSRLVEDSAFRELGSKIHFTGFVDRPKVHELFAMADAFVMPSVSEPFGLAALEAAQFGVPVILSRRSGAAEVLKGAVVADYWDIEKMVRSIVKILSDEKYRQSIIRRQRDDLKQVTWNHTALRIKEAYTRLIPS
jgi:glycosyltransferase involved in cell wall biosynthesis